LGSISDKVSNERFFSARIGCLVTILLLAAAASACNTTGDQLRGDEISSELQALVNGMIDADSDDPIHNAILLVESPKIKWKGAAGMADGKHEPMTADHKIKIASIGKTFTATMVLQLMEEGHLRLDDTIERFLSNTGVEIDSLHICGGVSYGGKITIRQLLSHTSGLADYMEDPRFIPDVISNPTLQYGPDRIMERYFEYGTNLKALFPPGEGYNYSDVNYVLLGMIIEHVTGETLQHELRTRIFDRLGMKNSYLEYYEEPRGIAPLSCAYFGTVDLVNDVNTSFDWGGGGIVSTSEELNTFFRALLEGELFAEESTLSEMLGAAELGMGGQDYTYGLGIMKRSIHGLTFYGHG
jgi:D-alanyl-D-alanine carboxypeptidase